MSKRFLLDTNVLLHDPKALLAFEDNAVLLPIYVIEEIDHFKRQLTGLGENARWISRFLDGLRREGRLSEGVPLETGGSLRVVFDPDDPQQPIAHGNGTVDNEILKIARHLRDEDPDVPLILVTKDVKDHQLVIGGPARPAGWVSRSGERLGADLVCPRTGERYREAESGLVLDE